MKHTEASIQARLWHWCNQKGHDIVIPNFHVYFEADVFSITRAGYGYEFEIKVTLADFRADKTKAEKHDIYTGRKPLPVRGRAGAQVTAYTPNFFFYVAPAGIVPESEIPAHAGFLILGDTSRPIEMKKAPKLHDRKVDADVLRQCSRSLMFRYWQLRNRRHETTTNT